MLVIVDNENAKGTLNFVSCSTDEINGESFVPLVMLDTKFVCILKYFSTHWLQGFTWLVGSYHDGSSNGQQSWAVKK